MKRYINKYIIGGLMTFALLATSCSSDYLDTTPTSSTDPNTAFKTTKNAAAAINGICLTMSTQYAYFGSGFVGEGTIKIKYGEYPGPNYNYNFYASGWSTVMNGQHNTRISSVYDAYPWAYYYTIIGSANSVILHVDEAEGTDADKQFIKAQALTFRAYAYEQLMQFYTKRWQETSNGAATGIPLRLDETTGDLACSSVADCYKQIYKDCTDAINLYTKSGEDRKGSEVWKPNINVAHAVYARAALNRQDYSTALEHAKLARKGFALMTNAEYVSGFCKPTSEWIWGSYGDESEQLWYWAYGTQYSCNGYYASSQKTGAGAIDRILINRIPNNDVRKSLFLTEDKFPGYNFSDKTVMNQTYAYFLNDDLREKAYKYMASITPSGLDEPYQAGYYYLDGQLKFWSFAKPGVSYLPHFRSSEMVLIEAEANYFLGNTTDAQNALIELNKTSGRNPNYTCTKTGNDLFQEIVDYRGVELFGEGFAWYDYKRWNKDMTRTSIKNGGNAHTVISATIKASDNNNWTWVIPQNETDYNTAIKE